MSSEYTEVLERLQQYRISKNMTQEQLSTVTGIGQSKMSKMEKGALIISYGFLKKLNDIHWDIDYLFVGENKEAQAHILTEYIKTIPEKRESKKLIGWLMESYFKYHKIENMACELFLFKSNLEDGENKTVLYNLRNYIRVNQGIMAEKLGIHPKKYRALEKEMKEPDAEVLLRLYLMTGCPPGIFFEDNKEEFLVNVLCQKIPTEKQKEMIEFVEASQKLFD